LAAISPVLPRRASWCRLRIDMEDRGGNVELLMPVRHHRTDPQRAVEMFHGEKFGRDPIWEGILATEIARRQIA